MIDKINLSERWRQLCANERGDYSPLDTVESKLNEVIDAVNKFEDQIRETKGEKEEPHDYLSYYLCEAQKDIEKAIKEAKTI